MSESARRTRRTPAGDTTAMRVNYPGINRTGTPSAVSHIAQNCDRSTVLHWLFGCANRQIDLNGPAMSPHRPSRGLSAEGSRLPTSAGVAPMWKPIVSPAEADDFRAAGASALADQPLPEDMDDACTIIDWIDQANSNLSNPEDDDDEDTGWGEMSQWDLDGDEDEGDEDG